MNKTYIALFFVCLLFVACSLATPYGPDGPMGGYRDVALGPNKWRVSYAGNQHLGELGTEKAFLRRAAELAKAAGYPYFTVSEVKESILEKQTQMGTGKAVIEISSVGPNRAVADTTYTSPFMVSSNSYRRSGLVTGVKADTEGAYSVDFILKATATED